MSAIDLVSKWLVSGLLANQIELLCGAIECVNIESAILKNIKHLPRNLLDLLIGWRVSRLLINQYFVTLLIHITGHACITLVFSTKNNDLIVV